MKYTFLIFGIFLIVLGLLMSKTEENPFFKKRSFKYYKCNKLVAWERRSYAEPSGYYIEKLGFGMPEFDKVIVEQDCFLKIYN